MKLKINRATWLRGEGNKHSALLRPSDNKMCCLGFLAVASGYTEEQISNQTTPGGLASSLSSDPEPNKWPKGIMEDSRLHTDNTCNLMAMNDDPMYSDEEREDFLKKNFARIGIEVEFV